jgi:hypothetical protein
MIHVTIEGFGSVWSKRIRRDSRNPEHQRTAYYNTTGVTDGGEMRQRSRIFGQLRFNGVGGFFAAGIERNIGRVFQCSAELDGTVPKLIFHHLLAKPQPPDFFMFAVTSNCTGLLPIESKHWKAGGVLLFALSQSKESQEAIFLMPAHSWFRGGLGTFIADPDRDRPWRATLRLLG